MKKGIVFVIILISILLFSNYVSAYSFAGRAIDDVKIFFASGDKKAEIAMEIREKEIEFAIENIKRGDTEEAIKNLERAKEKLEIVQQQASSEIADKVKENVEEVKGKIIENKDINPEFASYLEKHLTEEEKTKLSVELSEKIFEYCEELAKRDYETMLEDEKCDPKNAPSWLKDKVTGEVKELEKEAAKKMLEVFTTCINDPRECDCSEIPIDSEKTKCEKGKALAIRCEFQKDESACRELSKLNIEIPSNIPDFLKPLFGEKIENAINKKEREMIAKYAPSECIEAGAKTREECEAIMMEKYAPKECIEAGATTKEGCEKIMFAIHGPPSTECMKGGEFIGEEACNEKMIKSGMIPEECIKDGQPIPEEECRKIIEERGMMTGPPPECEGLSEEECGKIMEEKGMMPRMEPEIRMEKEMMIGKKEFKIPQECVGMTFQECEDYLMGKHMPQECIDSGALTPETCKKIMLPPECKQAGALSREECEAMMIKKQMPKECQDAGALTPEQCSKIMSKDIIMATPGSEIDYLKKKGISFDDIPSICLEGSNFVRGMECDRALADIGITLPPPADISNIPPECIKDGTPVSPQDCAKLLESKLVNENIPGPCREAGIEDPEKCGRFMEKEKRKAGMGMSGLPSECFGKSVQECKIIMDELGMEPIDVMGIMYGKIEEPERPGEKPQEKPKEVPRECAEMGITDKAACEIVMSKINEERIKNGDKMIVDEEGNEDYITNEQINKIAEEAERRVEEYEPDLEQAEEIKGEIEGIEEKIVDLEEVKESEKPEEEAPEPEQESSGGEEVSGGEGGGGEAAVATGETVREIEPQDNFLTRLIEKIFG